MYRDAAAKDLRMMFDETLVRYHHTPVYIEHIDDARIAHFHTVGDKQTHHESIDSDAWNFRPLSTGYVNSNGYCVYLKRKVGRNYKQGLHSTNMETKTYVLDHKDERVLYFINRDISALRDKGLINMALNIYPCFEEALEMLEDSEQVAFDRQFAVLRPGIVLYKARAVGTVEKDKIVFDEDKQYLHEVLK